MGACRESQNLFYHLKAKNYKKFWQLLKRFDKITYDDTFMPLVCKIIGHKEYVSDEWEDPVEFACKRCHRYTGKTMKNSKYKEWKLQQKRSKKFKRILK